MSEAWRLVFAIVTILVLMEVRSGLLRAFAREFRRTVLCWEQDGEEESDEVEMSSEELEVEGSDIGLHLDDSDPSSVSLGDGL